MAKKEENKKSIKKDGDKKPIIAMKNFKQPSVDKNNEPGPVAEKQPQLSEEEKHNANREAWLKNNG